uniref:Unannotated protein n=1 Tax=freshwater metagenome TaxID=449393 RepID=A0A6J5ZXS1_9ZZZZ
MDDSGIGRDDAELLKRLLPPAQELVALAVALELALRVDRERVGFAEGINLNRVVDHKLGRDQRLNCGRVAAKLDHGVAHRGKVDDRGDSGEILHQHSGGTEGDLHARLGRGVPAGEGLYVGGANVAFALVAQQVFQQDLQREGQVRGVEHVGERVDTEDLKFAAPGVKC